MGKFDYWILVRLFGSVPLSSYVPDNSKNTYTAFFIIPSLIAINTLIVILSLTAINTLIVINSKLNNKKELSIQ